MFEYATMIPGAVRQFPFSHRDYECRCPHCHKVVRLSSPGLGLLQCSECGLHDEETKTLVEPTIGGLRSLAKTISWAALLIRGLVRRARVISPATRISKQTSHQQGAAS